MPLLLLQSVADVSSGDTLLTVATVVLFVVTISAMWRLFVLTGEPGWAVLVPIYGLVVLLRVAGRSGWWTLPAIVPVLNILVALLIANGIARRFGRGVGFVLGLWLLPFVFYPLLAFAAERPLVRATI